MGLISRLLGTQRQPSLPPPVVEKIAQHPRTRERGRKVSGDPHSGRAGAEEMRLSVVGESHYQPAIRAACGAGVNEDVLHECFASLVPEPENPHDPNAVRVDIGGSCVGYLSRADARELGPAIAEALEREQNGLVRAVIAGRKDGETTNLGVFLHLAISRS